MLCRPSRGFPTNLQNLSWDRCHFSQSATVDLYMCIIDGSSPRRLRTLNFCTMSRVPYSTGGGITSALRWSGGRLRVGESTGGELDAFSKHVASRSSVDLYVPPYRARTLCNTERAGAEALQLNGRLCILCHIRTLHVRVGTKYCIHRASPRNRPSPLEKTCTPSCFYS